MRSTCTAIPLMVTLGRRTGLDAPKQMLTTSPTPSCSGCTDAAPTAGAAAGASAAGPRQLLWPDR